MLAASAYLRALKAYGIDVFYGTAGTDFPSIIEAFAQAGPGSPDLPEPVLVPHENLAVAMAHGHALVTGRPQAVMVHVSVGTANIVCGALNALRDRVPMLLSAGRTPVTEDGALGSRSRYIHWAQEMFDQAGMLREAVKWDYELRVPEEVETVVRRALEVATAAPPGPVYLSLPREALAAELGPERRLPQLGEVALPSPDPDAVDRLAAWIRAVEAPVLVTSALGADPRSVPLLAELAERWALPVVGMSPRRVFLPADHPMHFGYSPGALLREADLVLAVECDVPWIPATGQHPPEGARLVQIGLDPLEVRYPLRTFAADLSIPSDATLALRSLGLALGEPGGADAARVDLRRSRLAVRREAMLAAWAAAGADGFMPEGISAVLRSRLAPDTTVVNEYPLRLEQCGFTEAGTFFGLSPAGGLGWGLGAALGIKKAAPDRTVVAVLGDGAYMFNNPTACHWVSAAAGLPVLTVVFNNARWAAVRNSTLAMHGQGAAAAEGGDLFADLSPSPAYERVVEAHDGLGLVARNREELETALDRGLEAVAGGCQALVNVVCRY